MASSHGSQSIDELTLGVPNTNATSGTEQFETFSVRPETVNNDLPLIALQPRRELGPDEEHLIISEIHGFKRTPLRTFRHYTCCVVLNVLYAIFWAWFPQAYLRFRYLPVTDLTEAEYVTVVDKHGRITECAVEPLTVVSEGEYLDDPELEIAHPRPLNPNESILSYAPEDRMIVFRYRRFPFNPLTGTFELLRSPESAATNDLMAKASGYALSAEERDERRRLFGRNFMSIPVPSIPKLLISEILHPFFVFQIYSVILWNFENYFIFAAVIAVMAIVTVAMNLRETRSNLFRLRDLARSERLVKVVRGLAPGIAENETPKFWNQGRTLASSPRSGGNHISADASDQPYGTPVKQTTALGVMTNSVVTATPPATNRPPPLASTTTPGANGSPVSPTPAVSVRHESELVVETVSSTELVPGDVVLLDERTDIVCDMILLTGSVVVNEAMLTGESVPVVKAPIVESLSAAPSSSHAAQQQSVFGASTASKLGTPVPMGPPSPAVRAPGTQSRSVIEKMRRARSVTASPAITPLTQASPLHTPKSLLPHASPTTPGNFYNSPQPSVSGSVRRVDSPAPSLINASLVGGDVPIGKDSRVTLFAGSRIVQLKPPVLPPTHPSRIASRAFDPVDDSKDIDNAGRHRAEQPKLEQPTGCILAMVASTGFATTKGNMVSSIMFPPKSSFRFEQQSYKFVALMFGVAMIGFVFTIYRMSQLDAGISKMIVRACDLITIVVPPSLPLAMTVGISFSLVALQQYKIFCVAPAKINLAGKIKLMCFDKTGTLTSDSLQYRGVHTFISGPGAHRMSLAQRRATVTSAVAAAAAKGEQLSSDALRERASLASPHSLQSPDFIFDRRDLPVPFRACLATCHSLARHEGEFIGDPLEVEAFGASRASYLEPHLGHGVSFHAYLDTTSKPANEFDAELTPSEQRQRRQTRSKAALAATASVLVRPSISDNAAELTEALSPIKGSKKKAKKAQKVPLLSDAEAKTSSGPEDNVVGADPAESKVVTSDMPDHKPSDEVDEDYDEELVDRITHSTTFASRSGPTISPLSSPLSSTGPSVTRSPTFPHPIPTAILGIGRTVSAYTNWAVVKQFPFEAKLQRMSVLACDEVTGEIVVFAKGAPEMIAGLCDPSTIPPDFHYWVDKYGHAGFRVIALATKPFPIAEASRPIPQTNAFAASLYATNAVVSPLSRGLSQSVTRPDAETPTPTSANQPESESTPSTLTSVSSFAASSVGPLVPLTSAQLNSRLATVAEELAARDFTELRASAESGLRMLGLLVLENSLKPQTIPTLQTLTEAGVRSIMVTGDNAKTAVSIARECGIVPSGSAVFVSHVNKPPSAGQACHGKGDSLGEDEAPKDWRLQLTPRDIIWRNADDPSMVLDPVTFAIRRDDQHRPIVYSPPEDEDLGISSRRRRNQGGVNAITPSPAAAQQGALPVTKFELAVTGDAFAILLNDHEATLRAREEAVLRAELAAYKVRQGSYVDADSVLDDDADLSPEAYAILQAKLKQLQDERTSSDWSPIRSLDEATALQKVVLAGCVFARMTPDQKAALVLQYQRLGIYTGMCGDGANDCAALKTGHIGVSLAQCEASIAAPFTSLIPDISCIPTLLCEGRSSLITSFQLFRYMALYSVIQFISVTYLYYTGANYCDYQYLYQDLFVVFPLVLLLGRTPAAKTLSVKRPSGNLLSYTNLISVLLHIISSVVLQFMVFYLTRKQSGYVKFENPDLLCVAWEATTLHYYASFQYVVYAMLFAVGFPWKRFFVYNVGLLLWLIGCTTMTLCFFFFGPIHKFFLTSDDLWLPSSWKLEVFLFMILQLLVGGVIEFILIPWGRKLYDKKRESIRANTVFGKGTLEIQKGVKPFHALRRQFEDQWPERQPVVTVQN